MPNPLNDQISFQRLANILAQRIRRLVLFSGAGASREVGLPDWATFIDKLFLQYQQSAMASVGEVYIAELKRVLYAEDDPWKRVTILKNNMGNYFEIAVRNLLESFSSNIPTFYRKAWELNPDAMLSVNLDKFSIKSYDALKTGHSADYFTGSSVVESRNILGSNRKLVVDLHGNVDVPKSWVLSETDRDALLSSPAYRQFLREILSSNTVIFYGVSVDDVSISGQLGYLREIEYVHGEYFLVKRAPEASDWSLSQNFGIQVIYLGEDVTWEDGFSRFVDTLGGYRATDAASKPIRAHLATEEKIPSPDILVTRSPDEIRLTLNSATNMYYNGDVFDYDKYKSFCQEYDRVIHLATRVTPSGVNNRWLGNRITAELGKGNFGRVFSAEDAVGQSIAIKVAHADVRDDEGMLDSFRRGVESMRILTGSNIAGVVGIRDASELPPSIIMDYVQGVDFEKFAVDYFHISVGSKLKIIKWICEILFECHTHEKFVLHRDLRPSNVMISGEFWDEVTKEQINILDFDLSWYKGAEGSEFYMNAAQALGYLAPEQLNRTSKYSTRTALVDVYGVGMLLYFILSIDVPLANASTRVDWTERVQSAARKTYSQKWKSSVSRAYSLIMSATLEAQHLRPTLQEVMDELELLIGIHEGRYPFDRYSVLEEMVYRIFGVDAEKITRSDDAIYGISSSNVNIHIKSDQKFVEVKLEYVVSGSSNRTGRGKYLLMSLERAKSALKGVGNIDERKTGTELGMSRLAFTVASPTSLAEFDRLEAALNTAIAELPVKA